MNSTDAARGIERGGLAILGDVVVAPRAAFAALGERTHWGWAFVVTCALGLLGGALQIPAAEHVASSAIRQDPGFASLPVDKQTSTLQLALVAQRYAWLFFPIVFALASLMTAAVFRAACALAGGTAGFARLFGVAANLAVIDYGFGYLATGAVAALRGAAGFSSSRDLLTAIPSLAWLVPPDGSPKTATLLAALNPLHVWSFVLMALALRIVGPLSPRAAYATAAVVALGSALVPAAAAR